MKPKPILLTLIIAIFFAAACSMPRDEDGGSDTLPALTAAALTVDAQLTLNAAGNPGTTLVPPTLASFATNTPLPTVIIPPTATTAAGEETPCDRALFDQDVTIPDKTEMKPGQTFTKTWRLTNTGSCTWTSGYDVVFDEGDQMGGPDSQSITATTVPPGQSVDISVELVAPDTPGTYKGTWQLRNPSNVIFTYEGFWVEIVVVPESASFTAAYETAYDCNGQPRQTFKIVNDGDLAFEYMQWTISGPPIIPLNNGSTNAPFFDTPTRTHPECISSGAETLDPGGTAYVEGFVVTAPAAGTEGSMTIVLCTEDDGGGTCATKIVTFTW